VSRSIARLEARLGVELFTRTTRRVRLTDSGRAYFTQCRQALDQLAEAEREVTGRQSAPSGTLRISMPTSFGHSRVLPILADFRARYPDVRIDAHISNRNIDFGSDNYDLAIRARTLPESGLVARKLEDAAMVVVAAPSYLKRRGTPKTIEDLTKHDCLQFLLPRTGQRVEWLFRVDGKDVEVMTNGPITCLDDVVGSVTLARHGAGLAQTFRFIVEDDLKSGGLREVLTKFAGRSRPISLVYPSNRNMPRRVRVFVDFLVARMEARTRAKRGRD
jgi:DNA-binding transcriptional LysR family regulator